MTLVTVRIPELPARTSGLDLSLEDKLPIWVKSQNKTKQIDLQDLYDLIHEGGSGSHPPVVYGGEMIYIVPVGENMSDTASIPSLAGLDFNIELEGMPLIPQTVPSRPDAEFEILTAGGFKLLQDVLHTDQRYLLKIFSLVGGGGGGGTTGGSLIEGEIEINTNYSFNASSDIRKLVKFRSNATQVTLTLPSVDDVEEFTIIPIESMITNTVENKIATSGGQYIYFRNQAYNTGFYIRPGETLWIYRGSDGWYVVTAFGNWTDLARPFAGFSIDLNELICKGQEVLRADYPRLWAKVQTLGASLVTEATWQIANVYRQGNTYTLTVPGSGVYTTIQRPYRACFSDGDGSTTFRLPDLMSLGLRGVKSQTGSDDERYYNKPGGFQENASKKFWPGSPTTPVILQVDGTNTEIGVDSIGPTSPNIRVPVAIDTTVFKSENREDNAGVFWLIKC
ncbi:MAG: hypothetical protein ABIT05_01425 [Chitinophagaceae bacterium]